MNAYSAGILFGSIIMGLITGAVPGICGIVKKKIPLAIGGFFACFIGHFVLGLILSIPLCIIFTVLIFVLKPKKENNPQQFNAPVQNPYIQNQVPYNAQQPVRPPYTPAQNMQQPVRPPYTPAQNMQQPVQTPYTPVQNAQQPIYAPYTPVQNGQQPMQAPYTPATNAYNQNQATSVTPGQVNDTSSFSNINETYNQE